MRQGGVLYVLVKRASNLPRKPFFKGRFLRRRTALHVIAAGQEKKSMSVKRDSFPPGLSERVRTAAHVWHGVRA